MAKDCPQKGSAKGIKAAKAGKATKGKGSKGGSSATKGTQKGTKGKGKGADMATDILINAAKGKGRGYVIGSERWPRCEEWPAWAERFVQQRGYYRGNETEETSADGGGSWHGG